VLAALISVRLGKVANRSETVVVYTQKGPTHSLLDNPARVGLKGAAVSANPDDESTYRGVVRESEALS